MCPLILSLVALIPACQLICLKSSSARMPKIALIAISATWSPSASSGFSARSQIVPTMRWSVSTLGA